MSGCVRLHLCLAEGDFEMMRHNCLVHKGGVINLKKKYIWPYRFK